MGVTSGMGSSPFGAKETRVEDKLGGLAPTPLRIDRLVRELQAYPIIEDRDVLIEGLSKGFTVPVKGVVAGAMKARNLKSAAELPGVLKEKLGKEVECGRMAGPFAEKRIAELIISPLGVVPKKEEGKYRMIHHLSYPKGRSVNDAIDKAEAAVQYQSFDSAVQLVRNAGRGAMMAKIDIESAFRLLPLNPDSFKLMGCKFEGQFYVDKCLPMGCSISCSFFEKFSTFLHWLAVARQKRDSIVHYLDDFMVVGRAGTDRCECMKKGLIGLFEEMGVPVADKKTEGPCARLAFLGITIDSLKGQCELPEDKVEKAREMIAWMATRKKVTLREMQKTLGVLNFACKVIPIGRIFKRRLEISTRGAKKPEHMIRVTKEMRDDLKVWDQFLQEFNGVRIWQEVAPAVDFELYTDAAGGKGYGAYFQGRWCAGEWPESWKEMGWIKNLVLLELFPIVVAMELWGGELANRTIICWSDNMGVVEIINQLSASSMPVVKYLRYLVLKCLKHNICVRAKHIPGFKNVVADALSRFKWKEFRELAPNARQEGECCPMLLWQIGSG
ncbi:uncharacterized protein LOC128660298 isoform X1 [Bombina bombina]|uniref:uncharacterized protein LOC128660298 isoform X1 n=1 Tax=Bombina bombina TaxID=8345 RepID=UPI00235B2A6A|nr:uncharacterized protein LOC128660298 isoform X1 [Bombina bombina]